MAEKRTDIMEFIIRNNFIFNIPHFCVKWACYLPKTGPKMLTFCDMRLKNQYYCIFVFNNNYITGSSAYEGGRQKDRYETREADRINPVRLSTLGRSAGIRMGIFSFYIFLCTAANCCAASGLREISLFISCGFL